MNLNEFLSRVVFAIGQRFFGNSLCARLISLTSKDQDTSQAVPIQWDESQNVFSISNGKYYVGDFQRLRKFIHGLRYRGKVIGNDYHLDQVGFEPGDTVVDCGANIGDLQLYLSSVGVDLTYIGIEPSRRDFRILGLNAQLFPSLTSELHNCALGAEAGEVEFYEASDTADSSVLPIESYHDKYVVQIKKGSDALLDRDIKLIKIEAEGYEPEVLLGFEDCLPRISYISVDAGFERGMEQTCTAPEVVNFLSARGFRLMFVGQERLTLLFARSDLAAEPGRPDFSPSSS